MSEPAPLNLGAKSNDPDAATMCAVVLDGFGPPSVLVDAVVPRPIPLPSEVLVEVHAIGLNPVDWKTREGAPTPARAAMGPGPHILGWDVSGVVTAVGHGVHRFTQGDEVFGLLWFPRPGNAYAEYVTAPSGQFAPKPAAISHEQAAAVPLAALTAWHALVEVAETKPGQRVLIHAGAGGVGHFAVQIARWLGANITATASEPKREFVLSLGADHVVDYQSSRFEKVIEPVDVVLDLVGDGHDATTTRSLSIIKPGGVLVSIAPGAPQDIVQTGARRGVRVTEPILVEPDGAALRTLASLLISGDVRPHVAQSFGLDELAQAHTLGEANRTVGKIVICVR